MTNQKIKVLIVDDEHYSRDELKHLLSQFERVVVVGEADSGEKAILQAVKMQPDVVFLDMDMPKMNGLEVANSLKELKSKPAVVFATAYPNFAAEAFRVEAVDYLLKPFDEDDIKDTVSRLERKLLISDGEQIPDRQLRGKLAVEGDEEIIYIEPNEILYIYRDDKVTRIVGADKDYDCKVSLKELEQRLKEYSFFRIHKSYIVNLHYIKRLITWFNGAYQLELEGRTELLSVSRNYAKALREKLEI